MSRPSNQTYKELSIPYFNEVFVIFDEVLTSHQVPYYLIGVTAIALKLLTDNVKPSRGTKDIDFAIMVSSFEKYNLIIDDLVAKGFNKAKAPWTIYHPTYNVAVDLLPYGQIEENDTVNFNERYSDLHVLGFKEVLDVTEPIAIEERIANIPPLHGMVILKLIAWSDRPEERDNDPYDILRIIDAYYKLEWIEILDKHADILALDIVLASARVIGREIAPILKKSEALNNRILNILEQNIEEGGLSKIAQKWARLNDWTIEYATQVLMQLQKGILERIL